MDKEFDIRLIGFCVRLQQVRVKLPDAVLRSVDDAVDGVVDEGDRRCVGVQQIVVDDSAERSRDAFKAGQLSQHVAHRARLDATLDVDGGVVALVDSRPETARRQRVDEHVRQQGTGQRRVVRHLAA